MKKVLGLFVALFVFVVSGVAVFAQNDEQADRTITAVELKAESVLQNRNAELRLVRYPGDVPTSVVAGETNFCLTKIAVQSSSDDMLVTSIIIHSNSQNANLYINNIRFLQDGVQYGGSVELSPDNRRGGYSATVRVSLPVSESPTHVWQVVGDVHALAAGVLQVGIFNIQFGNRQKVDVHSLPIYGVNHSVEQQPAHVAGTNVQGEDGVWLITDVGTRRKYSSDFAFRSYSFNSIVRIVPMSVGDSQLPIGLPIMPVEGKVYSQSVQPNQGQVYFMSGNTKHAFLNFDVFQALGFTFSSVVPADVNLATDGYMLTSVNDRHPKGALINDHGQVFYTTEFGKMGIPSIAVFNSWGFSFSNVLPATSGDLGLPIETVMMQARLPGQLTPR